MSKDLGEAVSYLLISGRILDFTSRGCGDGWEGRMGGHLFLPWAWQTPF